MDKRPLSFLAVVVLLFCGAVGVALVFATGAPLWKAVAWLGTTLVLSLVVAFRL